MANLIDLCRNLPTKTFAAGETVMEENVKDGEILILKKGAVEIRRHGTEIATISNPGSTLGEIAVLLETGHSASAVALQDCEFFVMDHADEMLNSNPRLYREIACTLARRLVNVSEKTTELLDQIELDREQHEQEFSAISMWGADGA